MPRDPRRDGQASVSPRPYRMTARAEAAARTAESILAATGSLWREMSVDEITLESIAERAGVSVRTVIRRFGSRTGVLAATIETEGARISAERGQAKVGDVDGALEVLLRHYDRDGEAVLRTLALEERVPEARMIVEHGRAEHRAWCTRVFGARLPDGDRDREATLDALVAATDVYLWKLLRRDLGRSSAGTKQVMRKLIEGVLPSSHPEPGAARG